jgi:hypothetical protein
MQAPGIFRNKMLGTRYNNAFENGRADKQRAFGERPWRRAAQRKR